MELTTPYYVINKKELDENFKELTVALSKYWDNYIIGYSYKTNSLPWVIKYFYNQGCYAETVSEDEYNLAKRIGVPKNKIIYNGPIKTKSSFIEALENENIVNIDSHREIEWLSNVSENKRKIGIRINFDIEKYCPGQTQCGDEGGRFGFCYENGELEKAIRKTQEMNASIIGIHLHTSSKTRSLDIYKAIAEIACSVKQRFNLELEYIDIGGGFFGGLKNKPKFEDYFSLVSEILSSCFDKAKTKLIIEPGMALIGGPISYVTSVIDVKDTSYNRFVITDGSRTSIDPLMTKSTYFYSTITTGHREIHPKQVVCGSTCMEHDRLFVERNGETLQVGDKIVYDKVGAYTMCLTPLFISYFPDVYVNDNDSYYLVRKKWTSDQYIENSIIEVK